jgi:hypothetical protein
MSDKQLQRVTKGVADICHAPVRHALPAPRVHTTQKIRIAGIARSMSDALQYGASPREGRRSPRRSHIRYVYRPPSLLTASKRLQRGGGLT